jgi:hypothetical protein
MNAVDLLSAVGTLWPIFVGIITLIFVLSRLWTDVESLKEKVRTLFQLFNDKR